MLLLILIVALHSVVAITAAKWWMRPLMLKFDRAYDLNPCKESDFFFFCWSWSIVLVLMGLYCVWELTHPIHHWVFKNIHKKS